MSHPIPKALPHGEIDQVLPNLFLVAGSMKMGLLRFSRNMSVIKEGERLIIVNSMRLDDAGLDALDALGEVSDVIRLAGFHGSDDRFYKQRYEAKVWALRGQTYFKGLDPKKGEIYFTPDVLMDADTELPVTGASLYRIDTDPPEGILRLAAEGGTLITGDSLQNWVEADRYFNLPARLAMGMMGFIGAYNLGPGWVKSLKPDAKQIHGILDLDFQNLLPGHGEVVLGDAAAKFRPSVDAYVAKWG